jgi:hypothetical protein
VVAVAAEDTAVAADVTAVAALDAAVAAEVDAVAALAAAAVALVPALDADTTAEAAEVAALDAEVDADDALVAADATCASAKSLRTASLDAVGVATLVILYPPASRIEPRVAVVNVLPVSV